ALGIDTLQVALQLVDLPVQVLGAQPRLLQQLALAFGAGQRGRARAHLGVTLLVVARGADLAVQALHLAPRVGGKAALAQRALAFGQLPVQRRTLAQRLLGSVNRRFTLRQPPVHRLTLLERRRGLANQRFITLDR